MKERPALDGSRASKARRRTFHETNQPSPKEFSARSILDSTVSCDVTERDFS